MAKLSSKQRKRLPDSVYVYPKQKKYPLTDEKHARAALLMSAQKDTFGDYQTVKRAVMKKFPNLLKKRKKAA